jgi:hypothetical protein
MDTFPYHGEQLTMKQIAAREGVQVDTIRRRWHRYGRAENIRVKRYEYAGQMCRATEIALAEGISRQSVHARVKARGHANRTEGRCCSRCHSVGHYAKTCTAMPTTPCP